MKTVALCSPGPVALALPKSTIFGTAPVAQHPDQDVRRLEVAMDAFLVRMLNCVAKPDEELDALSGSDELMVAVILDGDPSHKLHHETA